MYSLSEFVISVGQHL